MAAQDYIYRELDLVGDGSGSSDMAVNGSITPVEFLIKPPAGKVYILKRMNVVALAASWARADQYGGIALTNGMRILIRNDSITKFEYTLQNKILNWADWGRLAGSDVPTSGGVGHDALVVRWTFAKGTGKDIELVGDQGDELVVIIQDNLSPLEAHTITVQGLTSGRWTPSH